MRDWILSTSVGVFHRNDNVAITTTTACTYRFRYLTRQRG